MAKPDVCFRLEGTQLVYRLPMVETLEYLRHAADAVEHIEQDTLDNRATISIGRGTDFMVWSRKDKHISERLACFVLSVNLQMWCMPMNAAIHYMRETARLLESTTLPDNCDCVLVTIGGDNHFTLMPIIEGEANNG